MRGEVQGLSSEEAIIPFFINWILIIIASVLRAQPKNRRFIVDAGLQLLSPRQVLRISDSDFILDFEFTLVYSTAFGRAFRKLERPLTMGSLREYLSLLCREERAESKLFRSVLPFLFMLA